MIGVLETQARSKGIDDADTDDRLQVSTHANFSLAYT